MAQNLREVYFHSQHRPDHMHISVNALLNIVRNTYNKNITLSFHNDSHKEHYLYSFLLVDNDNSYHICLMSEMTNCWNRFSLCKELFHVILDEESARNTSISEHLQDFRAAIRDSDISGRESSKSEILTEFAAMQFLFPYARRLDCLKEIDDKVNAGASKKSVLKDISTRLRIPRLLTEDYLEKELMDFFEAISWNGKDDKR